MPHEGSEVSQMTSKIRLLTRTFDLSVEGESVSEVEQLLDMVEKRGIMQARGATAGMFSLGTAIKDTTQNEAFAQAFPGSSLLDMIGSQGGPSGSSGSAEGRGIFRVLKREGDTYVLSPKFPPSPDGSERFESAAMVLLGGYDLSGDVPVTGSRLLKSLKLTGYTLERVDRALESLERQGLILTEGVRRGRRYRLSESGRTEARKLAQELSTIAGKPADEEVAA